MKICSFLGLIVFLLEQIPDVHTVLDDSIIYNINWPGKTLVLRDSTIQKYSDEDSIIMNTPENEKYKCMIPSSVEDKNDEENYQSSVSPVELLSPVLRQKSCAYRLEAYWSYEICHGKHIRQYHEEKAAGGGVEVQEFYLGKFSEEPNDKGIFTSLGNIPKKVEDIPSKKIDGIMTPYYSLQMTNGTPCGLKNGAARQTKVLYVCHPESRNEIMTISETSSCEYELIILTPVLCQNPFYKVKGNPVNEIYCTALDDSPDKPKALVEESKEMALNTRQLKPTKSSDEELDVEPTKNDYRRIDDAIISKKTDQALLREFLSGEFCLKGSSGWWNYEFCYGKYVKQYHDDKSLGRTIIMVGIWDEEAHLNRAKKKKARHYKETLNKNTNKMEKEVVMVDHFYHKGDHCAEVNKPREVVVKLKCKQSSSKHAVTIYLREPSTCSYILGVESPIICDLLETADENGMFSTEL